MIVIISDDKKENIGKSLYQYYKGKSQEEEVEFVSASGLDIKPCYGCEGCTYKTYGECVFRDDMDSIVPLLMEGDTIIYTSPMVWGGFSACIKRIVDKMSLTGYRFYNYKNGELVKGTISKMTKIVGIAESDKTTENERLSFENLLKEIGNIIDVKHLGRVVASSYASTDVEKLALEVAEL